MYNHVNVYCNKFGISMFARYLFYLIDYHISKQQHYCNIFIYCNTNLVSLLLGRRGVFKTYIADRGQRYFSNLCMA